MFFFVLNSPNLEILVQEQMEKIVQIQKNVNNEKFTKKLRSQISEKKGCF
jgi:hypothetical protein